MRVVFGIGNPGKRYEYTRHNAGFLLLDYFANKLSLKFIAASGEYLESSGTLDDHNFSLIKPVTFVNNSGIAAKQIFEIYSIEPEDFLVVCDDSNLENYIVRVRLSGGDGGHNGLSSIIYHLVNDKFPRIRIGIGKTSNAQNLADYVLSEFSESELKNYQKPFDDCKVLIESFITGGNKKMLETNSLLFKSDNQKN